MKNRDQKKLIFIIGIFFLGGWLSQKELFPTSPTKRLHLITAFLQKLHKETSTYSLDFKLSSEPSTAG